MSTFKRFNTKVGYNDKPIYPEKDKKKQGFLIYLRAMMDAFNCKYFDEGSDTTYVLSKDYGWFIDHARLLFDSAQGYVNA